MIIRCHPLLHLPSIFPSIRVFSNELAVCIRWTKYWSFSFSNSPSNEYSRLNSFRIDWFDLLAAQGTLQFQWWGQDRSSQGTPSPSTPNSPVWWAGKGCRGCSHPAFGARDCSPGHAGKEGPQLARTGASQGFPRAAAPVGYYVLLTYN